MTSQDRPFPNLLLLVLFLRELYFYLQFIGASGFTASELPGGKLLLVGCLPHSANVPTSSNHRDSASAPITQGPFPPPPPLPHPMVNSIHWQTTSPNVPNWNWQYPPMSGVPVSPVSHIDSSNSPSMFVATPIDALMDGANPDERETVVVPAPDNHMHDGRD